MANARPKAKGDYILLPQAGADIIGADISASADISAVTLHRYFSQALSRSRQTSVSADTYVKSI